MVVFLYMSPELARLPWRGVQYENAELGVDTSFYPLNYHFYPDADVFPVEVDMWKQGKKQGIQVGETSVVCVHHGVPVGGDIVLYVEKGSHSVLGAHTSRVTRLDR